MNPGTDVLATLPDLPRWVEARGMLLAHRGYVVDTADGCRLVCGRSDRTIVPVSIELSAQVEATATREVPDATIVVQDVMLPAARYHLPDWDAEAVTVYTLPPDRARAWRVPSWPTAPLSEAQIRAAARIPPVLRAELLDAVARTPVWAASLEGEPVSFAYAAHATEAWFDVSVATIESARNQGLARAAAMGLIVERMLRGLRPVWGAPRGNQASHRLALRLGFEPVDLVWTLTRRA